jgi:hypothetical protein
MSAPPQLFTSSNLTFEVIDSINRAFFLHLLANDPEKVVPPGKSILSMMSRPRTDTLQDGDEKQSLGALQRKVESMVHKAFWDEVRVDLVGNVELIVISWSALPGFGITF